MAIILCSTQDCNRTRYGRGLCQKHYGRSYVKNMHLDHPREREILEKGIRQSREYATWASMRERCNNSKIPNFHNYGGRGIKVCERWSSFLNFYNDMGKRPSPKHSLDRINVNGNYEPSNCRWATKDMQIANRRKGALNTSGYIGVFYDPYKKKLWRSKIVINKHAYTLGTFEDIEQAAIEYDKAVIFFRGDYGVTNIL